MIQESFQRCLNTTAPTAGHHDYAPTIPFQQNAFGALAENDSNNQSVAASIAMQVAALTHQSRIPSSTVAYTSQHHDQQMAHIASQQDLMHQNMHQIIATLNAIAFNTSEEGHGISHYAGGRGHGRARQARGRGCSPPMYDIGGKGFNPGGPTGGHMVPYMLMAPPMIAPAYCAPPAPYPPAYNITGTVNANIQLQPYSNITKRHANWNTCYSCGFDIPESHTSMTCPMHLHRPTHNVNVTRQNSQQYINVGHPCSTKNMHKNRLPSTM